MLKRTTARIGVGKAGPRLKTRTLLALRADHAQARDAVMKDVDPKVPESAGLFSVQTLCEDKNTYITRPDLGRKLNPEAAQTLQQRCIRNPDVQIYISDGLSSTAVEANVNKILPVITEALQAKGLKVGTPFYLRFGRAAVEVINDNPDYKFELGRAVTLREGKDATVIATGIMVSMALEAAKTLEAEGIDVRVLNIHTIKPLDVDAVVKAAKETGAIVVAEEHNIIGGLGSAVAEVLVENCPVPMARVGVEDKFGKSGKVAPLLEEYGLTAENIADKVRKLVNNK
jgi:pyruvate/2-oxoglutarate/acetoin dehydrogenase E1 component